MPVIKEEDLLKLYSDLEQFKVDNQKLEEGFVGLKLKCNKVMKERKRNIIILILLLIALLTSLLFLYFNYSKSNLAIKKTAEKELFLLDSIQKLSISIPNNNNNNSEAEVVYSIQLGVFKNLDIDFNNNENTNFKEVLTDNGNAYQLANFLSYEKATEFKNEIIKIGLKDVFLVPYNKNTERINIKEALVLSKEEQFIKD